MAERSTHPIELREFSSRDLRNALGAFPTGVTVITTRGQTDPYGLTANAFSSVSLDPPLVLVCVIRDSQGSECIRQNGCFAVNILTDGQEAVSRYFASKDRPRGADALAQVAHRIGVSGSPILDDTVAYVDCRVHESYPAGDHVIFIGEVLALGANAEARPLLFHGGRYCFLQA
jgi:flavin reductase (DIM6/NTAB) family NADH-FMN oxidoreductase RutF